MGINTCKKNLQESLKDPHERTEPLLPLLAKGLTSFGLEIKYHENLLKIVIRVLNEEKNITKILFETKSEKNIIKIFVKIFKIFLIFVSKNTCITFLKY